MVAPRQPKDLNKVQTVRFCSYNIRSGRGNELAVALRAMEQMNVDFGVFQEMKVTKDDIRTRFSSGYRLVCTDAASSHQGGVALFYRELDFFSVESVQRWGPNVISFVMTTGNQSFGCIGGYIQLDNTTTVQFIQKAMEYQTEGVSVYTGMRLQGPKSTPVTIHSRNVSS